MEDELHEGLLPDEIQKIILSLPQTACRIQVCDLFVNILIAYNMWDDFPVMALLVNDALERLSEEDKIGHPLH